jgi:hypothetical protein
MITQFQSIIFCGAAMRKHRFRFWAGWAVGWAVYMVAMAVAAYDGLLSLVFQPICGAVVSALAVGLAALLGLIFLLRCVGQLWRGYPAVAWVAAGTCLSVMAFGSRLGLTYVYTDPESGRQFLGLHPIAALVSYLLLVFVVTNWPTAESSRILGSSP